MNIKAIHTDIKFCCMNLYATVIASYTYIGSVDFYEVQRAHNKDYITKVSNLIIKCICFCYRIYADRIVVGIPVQKYCLFCKKTEKNVLFLLFLLGCSVSSNELIINNLAALDGRLPYWLFLLPAAVFWHRGVVLKIFLQERK